MQRLPALVTILAFACTQTTHAGTPGNHGFAVDNGPILNLIWSPDGAHIIYCVSPDCRSVDAATGRVTATMPGTGGEIAGDGQGVIGFADTANTLILPAPASDNEHFLTLWNIRTGTQTGTVNLLPVQRGNGSAAISSIAANGKYLAALSNGAGQPTVIYSLPALHLVRAVAPLEHDFTMTIALSTNGNNLATSLKDNTIAIYDITTGKSIGRVSYQMDWHVESISALIYSPDGKYLAAGFTNGGVVQVPGAGNNMVTLPTPWPTEPVYIWQVANGMPYGTPKKLCGPQKQGVGNMLWTKNSQAVIFTDGYGSTKLCPVTAATAVSLLMQDFDAVEIPALSPDGNTLAIGAEGYVNMVTLPKPYAGN